MDEGEDEKEIEEREKKEREMWEGAKKEEKE